MKHQQILDKLAFKQLNQAIDEDLARLVNRAMSFRKGGSITDISSYVLPKILTRWNCALLAENGLAKFYKEKVVLTLAILLHKYGFSINEITQKAIAAIDKLNDEVVLSDDFYRKSDQIKDFLTTKPKELKRKPAQPKNITFFRAKDVISINIDNQYYVAYIHELLGLNESPVIEFYDNNFSKKPKIEDLSELRAKGEKFNDGKTRKAHFAIYGMKNQTDLANQIHLIKSCNELEMLPESGHLEEAIGLVKISDLFSIQDTVRKMFSA